MTETCSKKNCDSLAVHKTSVCVSYCPKHYRFRQMRGCAKNHKKDIPTWDEYDILLYIWCPTFHCPVCGTKLEWHTNINGLNKVVSLQHNDNGTIMLICQGCNAGHSNAKLRDMFFEIKANEKYCPGCNDILSLDKFHKNKKKKKQRRTYCKKCDLLQKRQRYANNHTKR